MSNELACAIAFASLAVARVVYVDFLSRDARIKRTLARRPRTRIREAAEGLLRVGGRVRRRGEPLTAPVSGRACVAFQLLIEEQTSDGWATALDLRDIQPFVLADESGEALVDTSGPFVLALMADERGGTGRFDTIGLARLQALRSFVGSRAGDSRKLRYKECILKEGELVSVGGRGTREVSGDARSVDPREPPQWLVPRGTAEDPLLISDSLEANGGPWGGSLFR
jgi:hypothetical protein